MQHLKIPETRKDRLKWIAKRVEYRMPPQYVASDYKQLWRLLEDDWQESFMLAYNVLRPHLKLRFIEPSGKGSILASPKDVFFMPYRLRPSGRIVVMPSAPAGRNNLPIRIKDKLHFKVYRWDKSGNLINVENKIEATEADWKELILADSFGYLEYSLYYYSKKTRPKKKQARSYAFQETTGLKSKYAPK